MTSSKEIIRLSPSRISTLQTCSWSYYSQYVLKLPQDNNDGARRGTVCHDLLQYIVLPKHKKILDDILSKSDPWKNKVAAKYMSLIAKREGLFLDAKIINNAKSGFETNRSIISEMIMVALNKDFLGEKEGFHTEIVSEKEVEIKRDDNLRYHIKGIIDKTFVRRKIGANGKISKKISEIEIVDYKTSKAKFEKSKIEKNPQVWTYQFFAKKLYPQVSNIIFKFLFLRFPKSPEIEAPNFPEENGVDGFEVYLDKLTRYLTDFTEKKAKSNFAKSNGGFNLCGKNGYKNIKVKGEIIETTEPNYKCPYKDPFEYYALIDESGKVIQTSFNNDFTKNGKVEKRFYSGCPAWHQSKDSFNSQWKVLS